MKKIIILIITLLLTTGCYDYAEVNDLSFISSIAIDFKEEKFKLTFEVLSDKKSGGSGTTTSYTLSESGKTLTDAFDNITLKVPKAPFYNHIKAIIVSEEVAKDHMQEVADYIARNPDFRNEFYLGIAVDTDAEEIIKASNENMPIVGNHIETLIKSNIQRYNTSYNDHFEDLLEKFLEKKVDAITSTFSLEGKNIVTKGIALFDDYDYLNSLDEEQSALLNSLLDEKSNYLVTKKYDNKIFSISVYGSDTSFEFLKDKVVINISLEAEVKENIASLDLSNFETYHKINEDFAKIIKEKYENLIERFEKEQIDPLGINLMYFRKTKDNVKSIYDKFDIEIKTDVIINKIGLTFEVTHE